MAANPPTSSSGVKSRPARLALQHSVNDPSLSQSHDNLVGVTTARKRDKKSQFLPDVVKSSSHSGTFHYGSLYLVGYDFLNSLVHEPLGLVGRVPRGQNNFRTNHP